MFERFTERARSAVVLAQEQARHLGHNYIGTEHLLLGLLAEGDGVGPVVLREAGLTLRIVQADVEAIIGRGQGSPSGHIPFTPRAKKVLELSLREALRLGDTHIGSEHILLGLLREGDGVAAQILTQHNIRLDVLRKMVEGRAEGGGDPVGRWPPRPAYTPAADEIVAAAQQLAGGAAVGSHHLLEALARSDGSMAAQALSELGVDPDALSARLEALPLEASTDVTPDEASARKMELRVDGDEVVIVFRDADTLDRARVVLEHSGSPLRGDDPSAATFIALLRQVRTSLDEIQAALQPEPAGEPAAGGRSALVQRVIQSRIRRSRRP